MKTMQEEWEFFATNTYPVGMPPDQARQVRQAFFAGAFVALGNALPKIPGALGPEAKALFDEAKAACEANTKVSASRHRMN